MQSPVAGPGAKENRLPRSRLSVGHSAEASKDPDLKDSPQESFRGMLESEYNAIHMQTQADDPSWTVPQRGKPEQMATCLHHGPIRHYFEQDAPAVVFSRDAIAVISWHSISTYCGKDHQSSAMIV